jgi:hypothetical protein
LLQLTCVKINNKILGVCALCVYMYDTFFIFSYAVPDVDGSSVSGFSSRSVIIMLCLKQFYVIIIYISSLLFSCHLPVYVCVCM